MIPSRRLSSAHRRLAAGQTITLQQLDRILAVPPPAFERTVAKQVATLRKKLISVDTGAAHETIAIPADTRISWPALYEAQVQRLPKLDREQEFAMARRYEFMRARASASLRELGMSAQQVSNWLAAPSLDLAFPRVRSGLTAPELAYLEHCLGEFLAVRSAYVQSGLALVLGGARRYRGLGVDVVDLIQEGNASLFQAIEGFDWRRDVRFKTYAQYWIQQAILKLLYNASRTVRVPVWVQKSLKKIQRVRDAGRRADGVELTDEQVGERLGMTGARVHELATTRRYALSLDAELPGSDGASLVSTLADYREPSVVESVTDEPLRGRLQEVMADLPERERIILSRRYGLGGKDPETLGEIAVDLGITAERVRQLQKAALARLQRPLKLERLRAFAS